VSKDNIIRIWKDPEYRSSLSAHQNALLPPNPAGTIDDGKLAEVAGGAAPVSAHFGCSFLFWCETPWLILCSTLIGC
jgi:mersacidin/lichenicidin family type 2 lantibiotic